MSNNNCGFKSDPLWALILSELKASTFLLDPVVQDFIDENPLDSARVLLSEREYLLSQIDDALQLALPLNNGDVKANSVDIVSLVGDFADAYSSRFGARLATRITALVDNELPIVRSSAESITRIIDCFVRSIQRSAVPKDVEIVVRQSGTTIHNDVEAELVIVFSGVSLSVSASEAEKFITDFENGSYLKPQQIFGLEFCTAMHILRRLGGKIRIIDSHSRDQIIEVRIRVDKIGRPNLLPVPETIYLCTRSHNIKGSFERMASFYRSKLVVVDELEKAPQEGKLVVDALNFSDAWLSEPLPTKFAPRTILLLPENDISRFRRLAAFGYRYFLAPPWVSSKLIRVLSGFDRYELPEGESFEPAQQKLRILVVDDAPTARILIRDFFEALGHGVIEASDGSEALVRIQRGELFDIIFCDLTMCHLDGATMVRKVRECQIIGRKPVPIILVTAHHRDPSLLQVGFDRVLAKPVSASDLRRVVAELIPHALPKRRRKETQIIDLEDLRNRCGGRTKTMINVLESFISTIQPLVPRIKAPEVQENRKELVKALHTIKGVFRDVGAKGAAHSVEQIESRVRETSYGGIEEIKLIEELVTAACQRAAYLKNTLAEKSVRAQGY